MDMSTSKTGSAALLKASTRTSFPKSTNLDAPKVAEQISQKNNVGHNNNILEASATLTPA